MNRKHYYRFTYLKSEEWKGVRLLALARDKARCNICGVVNWHNDAHHKRYPKDIWKTQPKHLVTLCRKCHSAVHELFGDKLFIVQWEDVRKVVKRSNSYHHCIVCGTENGLAPIGHLIPNPHRAIKLIRSLARAASDTTIESCPKCAQEIQKGFDGRHTGQFWRRVHELRGD